MLLFTSPTKKKHQCALGTKRIRARRGKSIAGVVVDLRAMLGMSHGKVTRASRNLIIKSGGELIGLMVDRLADILTIRHDEIEMPPANVSGVDGKFFRGVHTLESEIVVILDLEAALNGVGESH